MLISALFSALGTCAVLGRDRLREESFMLSPKNKAKHTFTCSLVASLAFPLP